MRTATAHDEHGERTGAGDGVGMKRPHLLLLPGLLALLVEPSLWLWRTWWDPAWSSSGAAVFLVALALTTRSVLSGAAPGSAPTVWPALVAAAAARAVGRLLSIHLIGALALVIDAWALARALRVDARPQPVSPLAISALVMLSLPVEHVGQQLVSWPLRTAASALTAALAQPWVGSLEREGTLLIADGHLLEIDVPCSGLRGALALAVLAVSLSSTLRMPPLKTAVATLGGALLANVVRLWILVVGPTALLLEGWPHDLIGLVGLAAGAAPLLYLARRSAPRTPVAPLSGPPLRTSSALTISIAALLAALLPHRPLDVSAHVEPLQMPMILGERISEPRASTAMEDAWVATWGGALVGRSYVDADGVPHTAVALTTTAPVRHLHGVDACLRGAGHQVERIAHLPTPLPTTVWRSTDPSGAQWRVATTFIAADGTVASTPSEVALRWLQDPGTAWTRLDRITPWAACEAEGARCRAFDADLVAALDLLEAS